MQITKSVLIASVLLGICAAAGAQNLDENRSRCRSGDIDLMIAGCTRVIQSGRESHQDLAIAFYNRGSAYAQKGQYDSAIQDFDQTIKLKHNFPEAFVNRGSAYRIKGQYDSAIQDFDQAIKLKHKFPEAFASRGGAYLEKGQYDRAIQDFDEANRLSPHSPVAFYGRGAAYYKKGEYDRAIQEYDEVIRLKHDFPGAFYGRGAAYYKKGEYDRAIQEYDEAIRLKPQSPEALDSRGQAYYNKGEYDRAIQDYDEAIRLKPDYASAFKTRGRVKFYLGRFQDAARDFQNALNINSSDAYMMLWLHLAMHNAGQDDTQAFPQQAEKIDSSKWPAPVVNLFLGKLAPEQTLAAAANPDSIKENEQQCEAEFYIGEFLLLHHETPNALLHFRAARNKCPHNYVEYEGAGAEMARLSAGAGSGNN